MPWLKVCTSLPRHPKVSKLSSRMGWNPHETIGRLICFWLWHLEYKIDGVLEGAEPSEIAAPFGVPPDKAQILFQALIDCKLIDEQPLRIHGWLDSICRYLDTKYRNHNRNELKEIYKKHGRRIRGSKKDASEGYPTSSLSPSQSNSISKSGSYYKPKKRLTKEELEKERAAEERGAAIRKATKSVDDE